MNMFAQRAAMPEALEAKRQARSVGQLTKLATVAVTTSIVAAISSLGGGERIHRWGIRLLCFLGYIYSGYLYTACMGFTRRYRMVEETTGKLPRKRQEQNLEFSWLEVIFEIWCAAWRGKIGVKLGILCKEWGQPFLCRINNWNMIFTHCLQFPSHVCVFLDREIFRLTWSSLPSCVTFRIILRWTNGLEKP